MFNEFFNRAVHKIKCNNFVEPDRPHMTTWRIRNACWIPNATNTHSEYVIYCFPPPLQQWLREHGPMLRYTYSACFVISLKDTGNVISN